MVTETLGRRPYVPLAILGALFALLGFWPSYFGPLVAARVDAPAVIHFHAAVFVGWLVLFFVQVWLAANGRVALHVKLGRLGMVYGLVLIVVGLATGLVFFRMRIAAGDLAAGQRLLYLPVADIGLFSTFFALSWIYRKKPELHKRLMLVAATVLLTPAVARMRFLVGSPPVLPLHVLVWISPILFALGHDLWSKRLVHPVYVVGIGALTLQRLSKTVVPRSEAWLHLTESLASLLA